MTTTTTTEQIVPIPLSLLSPGPWQPRRRFDDEGLQELAASIREHGVLTPLAVMPRPLCPDFYIIAGERRYRAAQIAGRTVVPCRVLASNLDDVALRRLALLDNLHREDLKPAEEANALQQLAASGLTQRQIAEQVGKSQPWVAQRLALLKLPEAALDRLDSGGIGIDDARELLKLQKFPDLIDQVLDDERKENGYERFDGTGGKVRELRPVRQRIKDALDLRAREEERRQAIEKLKAEGKQIVEDWEGYGDRRYVQLNSWSEDSRVHKDAGLTCEAWVVPENSNYPIHLCTDPAALKKAVATMHADDPAFRVQREEAQRERSRRKAEDDVIVRWLLSGANVNSVDLAEALFQALASSQYRENSRRIGAWIKAAGLATREDTNPQGTVADSARKAHDADRLLRLWWLCQATLQTGVQHWAQDWLRSIGYADPTLIVNSLGDGEESA